MFSNQARDWAIDPSRIPGDVDIVVSDIGYHILFYAGESAYSYRYHTIEEHLRSQQAEEWLNAQIAAAMERTERGNLKTIDVSTPLYRSPQ